MQDYEMREEEYYEALAMMIIERCEGENILLRFSSYREGKSFSDIEDIRANANGGGLELLAGKLKKIVEINTSLDLRRYKLELYHFALD